MTDIFLSVLNMSITASYVILAVLVIRLLLRKAPKRYSYLLWLVVGFRLACPVSFPAVFSLFSASPFDLTPAAAAGAAALEFLPTEIGLMAQPQLTVGIAAADQLLAAALPALPAATPAASVNPLQIWLAIGAALWCAGAAALAVYSLVSYLRLRRGVAAAVLVEPGVYQSENVPSPFILGWLRPRLYLPWGLEGEALRHVLAHERCHLRRGDHLVKPLAFALLGLHWFNPLVWLAFVLMSRDMEMSCDEQVLAAEDCRRAYSATLLTLAVRRPFPRPCPLAFGESGVSRRIKNVLAFRQPRPLLTAVALVLCLTVLAACAANPPAPAEQPAEPIPLPAEEAPAAPEQPAEQPAEPLAEDQPVILTPREIDRVNQAFEPIINTETMEVNPISHLFTSFYDRPQAIDLAELLRYFPSQELSGQAEYQAVRAHANWPFDPEAAWEDLPQPINKIPAASVEPVLRLFLGLGLADLEGVGGEELIYLPEYDAYYNFTSDFAAGIFHCVRGERVNDDLLRLYTSGDAVCLTLTRAGDSWLITSHQRLE